MSLPGAQAGGGAAGDKPPAAAAAAAAPKRSTITAFFGRRSPTSNNSNKRSKVAAEADAAAAGGKAASPRVTAAAEPKAPPAAAAAPWDDVTAPSDTKDEEQPQETTTKQQNQLPPSEMAALAAANAAKVQEVLRAAAATNNNNNNNNNNDNNTPPRLFDLLVEPTWREALKAEFDKPYARRLEAFVHGEWAKKSGPVYPPPHQVFRALNSVPLPQCRVVVLGQDPYHGPGQAEGLSFSVPRGVAVPSSLRNIYRELSDDIPGFVAPGHGSLEAWAHQGVLLLNATLTVRGGDANSHAKASGWLEFTAAVVDVLSRRRKGLVFLLWGKFAQDRAAAARVDGRRHHLLKSPHPSGLSAHRGFFGCRHFSQANAMLEKEGLPAIDWRLPR
jgi:uracil-DNA glycosylase